MKCGANAKPPSNDPCAACLGPGFISIMRSIYSVVMTRGYEKRQILLKTQAHPPNPVWKDGLIHRWNSHDMSAHTKWDAALAVDARRTGDWCLKKRRWRRKFGVLLIIVSGRIMFVCYREWLSQSPLHWNLTLEPENVYCSSVRAASVERFKISSVRFACFWSQPSPL